jgi:hypothetical protein
VKGRSVPLSTRVRKEIETFSKQRPTHSFDAPLIQSQRNRRAFSTVTLSMLFKEIYELAGAFGRRPIPAGGRSPLG